MSRRRNSSRVGPKCSAGVAPGIRSERDLASLRVAGRALVPVVGIPGFYLAVRPSGARSWVLRYRSGIHVRTYTLGGSLTLAKAKAEAERLRALIALKRDPQAELMATRAEERQRKLAAITIEHLCRQALGLEPGPRPLKLRPSTAVGWRRLVEREIVPALGRRPAQDVTKADVRAWGEAIARRAPYVANRAHEVLRRVYSWAQGVGLLTETPFQGLLAPAEETESDRVLSTEELRALWRVLGEGTYPDAVRLLLLTGVRREMVLTAKAQHVDLGESPRWTVPAALTKGGRPHVVPLSRQAVVVIERRLGLRSPWLFPAVSAWGWGRRGLKVEHAWWSSKWVSKLRQRMQKALGCDVPRWTVHNLRHTVATHLREDLGVSADVIGLILSHTRPGVTRIYQRAELLEERRAALQRWADWLDTLTR